MASKSRLDKALNGLRDFILRENIKDIQVFSDKIIVGKKDRLYETVIFAFFIVAIPVGIFVYYLFANPNDSDIGILLIAGFAIILWVLKLVKKDRILTIAIQERQIYSEAKDPVFKKIYTRKQVAFDEIKKIEITETTESASPGQNTISYLTIFSNNEPKKISVDFGYNFLDRTKANKIKLIIEVMLQAGRNSKRQM
ncbi:MAG TPA: hypothetical protein VK489_05700 [Ferruginibacter sp.]|nr:hypothetical protein [Ferruginibacter sp.]